MKPFLQLQARRVNALSLRERAIMFVSLAFALVALADALVLSPRMADQKALAARLRQQSGEVQDLRVQLAGANSADTPVARLQRQLQEARAQQLALDGEIERRLADGGNGARLPELLERVLRRHDRLLLLRLVTVQDKPDARNASAGGLPLRGVDIAVRGAYLELVQYLADAEKALPGLRWGELSITRTGATAELAARVYLVGDMP